MIAYIDSSVLARAYLPDEPGHEAAAKLLEDPEIGLVTGTWTRIEVSGALMRAAGLDAAMRPGSWPCSTEIWGRTVRLRW